MRHAEYLSTGAVQSDRGLKPHLVTAQLLALGLAGALFGVVEASLTSLPYVVPAYCWAGAVLFALAFEVVERTVPAGVTARRDVSWTGEEVPRKPG